MHGNGESETLARGAELAVYQCGHGLLHLRVNRVTLTLKPEEFSRLATLVGEAHIRLGTREGPVHVRDALDAPGYGGADMTIRARTALLLALLPALLAPGLAEAQGILLLAHGGRDDWKPGGSRAGLASRLYAAGRSGVRHGEQAHDSGRCGSPDGTGRHRNRCGSAVHLVAQQRDAGHRVPVGKPRRCTAATGGLCPPWAPVAAAAGSAGDAADFDPTTPLETTVPISVTTAPRQPLLWLPRFCSPAPRTSAGRRKKRSSWWVAHGPELGGGQRPLAGRTWTS